MKLIHVQVSKKDDDQSSLKIRIQLDLDVEIHLTARVKVSSSRRKAYPDSHCLTELKPSRATSSKIDGFETCGTF